jgi:hypothetical protein
MLSKAATLVVVALGMVLTPLAGTAQVQQEDTTPPVITARDIEVQTNSDEGSFVFYTNTITARDDSGQPPTVTCDPVSGAYFLRGITTVSCIAADAAGNEASTSFRVFVANPALGDIDVSLRAISLSTEPARAGQIVNYYVDVYNSGPIPLHDGTLTISVPLELELLFIPEACTAVTATLSCAIDLLNPKRIASFTMEGRVDREALGPLELDATVTLPAAFNDLLPENNTLRSVVGVQPAPAPGTEMFLPLIRR